MLENARALAREYAMFPPGATVLCAVSGGADSMCLLHFLTTLDGLAVHAAHFNHQLRGEESDRDEAFVRDWCQSLGIPLHLGRGDVAGRARQLGRGVEETARELRYAFLRETAEAESCSRIATAHTADDNAETVLLHLLRGAGLQGLTGMDPRRDGLIRPLLTTSRREIEEYLRFYSLPHVEDSSNSNDAYLRNRVRHQLLPLLEDLNPGFVRRLTAALPRLQADNECLDGLARQLLCQAVRRGEDLVLPAAVIAQAPDPAASRCVRLLMAEASRGDRDCSAAHIDAVLSLCRSGDPSGEVHLPHGLTALREYDALVLTHDPAPPSLAPFVPRQGENPVEDTGWILVLDSPPWEGLTVRSRREGDAITLPGRPRKSLKKLFIDAKLPRRARERVPVAADGEGVAAAAGFGPSIDHPKSGQLRFIQEKKEEKMT